LFDRDSLTGNLTFANIYQGGDPGGSAWMDHAEDVLVAPEGDIVYMTTTLSDSLLVMERNQLDGPRSVLQILRKTRMTASETPSSA
jgi:hypothetical protein